MSAMSEFHYLGELKFEFLLAPDYTDRELLQNLLGAVDLPMLVVNRAGCAVLWNQALTAALGEGNAPALGDPVEKVLPELASPLRGRAWTHTLREEVIGLEQMRQAERVPLALGHSRHHIYDVTGHPLRRAGGAVLGAVVVLRDVSARVRMEQLLLRSARTTSLANLGASVAHEIRNPLNSIGLNLARLQERLGRHGGKLANDTLPILELLTGEVKRLDRIVTRFLEFSRPTRPASGPVDLVALTTRSAAVLQEEAATAGVDVRLHLPPLPAVPGDPDRVVQALQNLLRNAIQAAGRGGFVEIAGFQTPDAVAVAIRDSGPGLSEEARHRVFDLFYSTKEGGTGLGLPIANRIAEDHGGHLTVENSSSGGAVFTFYLPRTAAAVSGEADDRRWV